MCCRKGTKNVTLVLYVIKTEPSLGQNFPALQNSRVEGFNEEVRFNYLFTACQFRICEVLQLLKPDDQINSASSNFSLHTTCFANSMTNVNYFTFS